MSPTSSPGQPASLCTLADSRSSSATMSGCAQLRLRDSRITCQVGAVDRQCFGAGDAALGVEADHAGRHRRRQHLAAEQLLGAQLGIVGIGERRQRLGIDTALVLRQRCGGAGESRGQQQEQRENQARGHRGTLRRTACQGQSQLVDQARAGAVRPAMRAAQISSPALPGPRGFPLVQMIGQRQRHAVAELRFRKFVLGVEQDAAVAAIG